MPQAIGAAILVLIAETPLIAVLGFGAASAISSALGTAAVSIALSFGTAYLSQQLRGGNSFSGGSIPAPRPEDVQQSTRQATAPRIRHYGRVKTSGAWVFGESYSGHFYKVLALGHGEIDAFESYWLDEEQVTVDSDGYIASPFRLATLARIQVRRGVASETHYERLEEIFPEWDATHRGDGVVSLFSTQYALKQRDYLGIFPNGINTSYRVVLRGARVRSPITGLTAWSDNAAAVVQDYMTHADGMRLPLSLFATPQADAAWKDAFLRSTEDVALAAGGSEDRYRLWGSYRLDERPAEVLGRMLACCDGRLFPTSDGGLALDVGAWAEPSVVIDESVITGFSDLSRGKDILSTANTIRATYTEPSQDYQTAEADTWVDEADVSDRGEISADIAFPMAPSHSQCRRLMKLAAYRANPDWTGQFTCNLRALAAINKRFVRLRYGIFGIDEVMEIVDFRLDIAEGGILRGVILQAQSMPPEAYQWSPGTEEGIAPVTEYLDVTSQIPLPEAFDVTLVETPSLHARLSFAAPPSPALITEARGKLTADTEWTDIAVSDGATSASSFGLTAGTSYDFQIRHATLGTVGDWTPSITILT